jgi:ankyrin repeat protein
MRKEKPMSIGREFTQAAEKQGQGPKDPEWTYSDERKFLQAACEGQYGLVERYCKKYPEIVNATDSNGNTALMLASLYSRDSKQYFTSQNKVIRVLSTVPNINTNAQNKFGDTALMLASSAMGVQELLKIPNLDTELVNKEGKTAMNNFIDNRQEGEAIVLAKDIRLDPNRRDKDGKTYLMRSKYFSNGRPKGHPVDEKFEKEYSFAATLIDNPRTDLNARDNDGIMALVYLKYQPSIVSYMLSKPCIDPNVQDNHGRTPVMNCIGEGDSFYPEDTARYFSACAIAKHPRCDLGLKSKEGSKAVDIAVLRKNRNMALALCNIETEKTGEPKILTKYQAQTAGVGAWQNPWHPKYDSYYL